VAEVLTEADVLAPGAEPVQELLITLLLEGQQGLKWG